MSLLHTLAISHSQAKDKTVAAVEKAVKALKDDAKKNGELYVKFMKKSLEKVRGRAGWQQQ
jgi:hypothetical protein